MRQFFEITKEGTEITKVILIVKNKLYKRVEVFKLEKMGNRSERV